MLRRLLLLSLTAAIIWWAFRRLRSAPRALPSRALTAPTVRHTHAPPAGALHTPDPPPPPAAHPWPPAEHAPAPAEVAEQAAGEPHAHLGAAEEAAPPEEAPGSAVLEPEAVEQRAHEAHENAPARQTAPIEGYCVRCKARRTMAGARVETSESGRRTARGTCPVCGARMNTFLPAAG